MDPTLLCPTTARTFSIPCVPPHPEPRKRAPCTPRCMRLEGTPHINLPGSLKPTDGEQPLFSQPGSARALVFAPSRFFVGHLITVGVSANPESRVCWACHQPGGLLPRAPPSQAGAPLRLRTCPHPASGTRSAFGILPSRLGEPGPQDGSPPGRGSQFPVPGAPQSPASQPQPPPPDAAVSSRHHDVITAGAAQATSSRLRHSPRFFASRGRRGLPASREEA